MIYNGIKNLSKKPEWLDKNSDYELFPPNQNGRIRYHKAGLGIFGAKRGNRYHAGVDYWASAGDDVIAPVSGHISKVFKVYDDLSKNKNLQGIVIEFQHGGVKFEAKLFYVKAAQNITIGVEVIGGETIIGTVQDLIFIHDDARDHIHLEVRDSLNNPIPPRRNFF